MATNFPIVENRLEPSKFRSEIIGRRNIFREILYSYILSSLLMYKLTKANTEGWKKKKKKKGKEEIVATFKANEKSLNGVTGRLRHVIAARCNCERAVQRLNPLPLFAPVLVSIAGRHQEQCSPHSPSPLQLPPRRGLSGSCEGGKNSFTSPRYPSRPGLIVRGSRVKESWRHCIVRPPTSITADVSFARGKENFKFQRASKLLAWLMAGKVRGEFHHRIQIVGGNLWRARTNWRPRSKNKKKTRRNKKGTPNSFLSTEKGTTVRSKVKRRTFENSRRNETEREFVSTRIAYRCKKKREKERKKCRRRELA